MVYFAGIQLDPENSRNSQILLVLTVLMCYYWTEVEMCVFLKPTIFSQHDVAVSFLMAPQQSQQQSFWKGQKTGTKANISVSLVLSVLLIGSVGTALAGTIYVDANAAPGGDGTTWGMAYKYLQDALYKPPTSGDQIWIAEGTYKPDQDEGSNVTAGDRNATFELINGVSLYGGFPIGGGTWEERDPNLHETILSGDLNGDDGPDFANYAENSYNVCHISWASGITTLDGFTVTGGNANILGSIRTSNGAGLHNEAGGDTILVNCTLTENKACYSAGAFIWLSSNSQFINCTFSYNYAQYSPGGLYLYMADNVIIESCKFIGNNCMGYGGGLYLYGGNPIVINSTFIDNTAGKKGGGLYCHSFGGWPEDEIYSNPIIINSIFKGNTSDWDGGAIYFRGECRSNIVNCSFTGNSASDEGGAIYEGPVFQSVYANFINCSIVKNSAGAAGGGINAKEYDASNSSLTNCIVWGNEDSTGTGESAQILEGFTPGRVTVNYSCIQDDDPDDGYIPFGGAANNNIDDNPVFVRDPYDGGDGWGVGDNDDYGNLRLQYISPCIDTADNTAVPADSEDLDEDLNTTEPIPYDLDGHPRIVDGDCNTTEVVDMGAYEFSHVSLGDFAGGCDVDFADFAVLALAWLTEEGQAGYNSNCDIAIPYDKAIDEKDLQVFTGNWLFGR